MDPIVCDEDLIVPAAPAAFNAPSVAANWVLLQSPLVDTFPATFFAAAQSCLPIPPRLAIFFAAACFCLREPLRQAIQLGSAGRARGPERWLAALAAEFVRTHRTRRFTGPREPIGRSVQDRVRGSGATASSARIAMSLIFSPKWPHSCREPPSALTQSFQLLFDFWVDLVAHESHPSAR
jgi:hypothetical protein